MVECALRREHPWANHDDIHALMSFESRSLITASGFLRMHLVSDSGVVVSQSAVLVSESWCGFRISRSGLRISRRGFRISRSEFPNHGWSRNHGCF